MGKDGREVIIEVNDCAMGLLGESQEEDRRHIAEVVLEEMESWCCSPQCPPQCPPQETHSSDTVEKVADPEPERKTVSRRPGSDSEGEGGRVRSEQ